MENVISKKTVEKISDLSPFYRRVERKICSRDIFKGLIATTFAQIIFSHQQGENLIW